MTSSSQGSGPHGRVGNPLVSDEFIQTGGLRVVARARNTWRDIAREKLVVVLADKSAAVEYANCGAGSRSWKSPFRVPWSLRASLMSGARLPTHPARLRASAEGEVRKDAGGEVQKDVCGHDGARRWAQRLAPNGVRRTAPLTVCPHEKLRRFSPTDMVSRQTWPPSSCTKEGVEL